MNENEYRERKLLERYLVFDLNPILNKPRSKESKGDWNKRDHEVLEQITNIAEQLMTEEGKPRRITVERIQEIMGRKCLMPKHLKKMPLTKAFLIGVIEDSETFQKRRALWAIGELKSNDESLTLNRVRLKAGVSQIPEGYLLGILSTAPK